MNTSSQIPKFKTTTLALAITSVIYTSPAAFAQDDELEEIQITGTRIRMTDGMAEPTPVTSMTPLELATFEPGGTVAEQLSSLPQFFNVTTAQSGTPGLFDIGAGSYLNMRGLNANRTLVLLDGSRVPPADKRGQVNVDNFPTALMRSVDVVTGGASAAYGADALGGVTNFVLDREFEGFKVEVSTGMNEFNKDEKNYNVSLAGGHQFGDRLHVIASLETQTVDEIYRAAKDLDPDWYRRWGYVTNPKWVSFAATPGEPQRIVTPWVSSRSYNAEGVISGFPRGSTYNGMTFTENGSDIRPFVVGEQYYNTTANASVTSGGPEVERAMRAGSGIVGNGIEQRSGFVGLQYDVSDSLTVFGQALVGRVESLNIAEHTGYSMGNQGPTYYLSVFRENPYLPPALAAAMDSANVKEFKIAKAGNYLGEYAPGALEFTHSTFTTESWQLGFDYRLPNDWNVRASWQSGETHKRHDELPSARIDREALARDAVRDPKTGAIVCNVQLYNPTPAQLAASPSINGLLGDDGLPLASPIGLDNTVRDCVPYNVMGAEGMSEQAWAYIHTPKSADSNVEQDFAEVLLTGEAYEGWGYGPVSFAAGLTYREQSFEDYAPQADVNNLGPPQNDVALGIRGIPSAFTALGAATNLHQFSTVENISGEYDVWEAFGELQLPIWESRSGDQSLGGNVAYRSSDYSSSGRSESWKLGLEFQVIEGLRLRATRSRDVREAAFNERFDKGTIGTTVTNSRTGLSDIATVASVGNPNLRPELADSVVAGFVYQPAWLEGLSVSTDWYEVDISDAIATLGAQVVVDQCFNNNDSCENVITDPVSGAVVKIFNPQLNLAGARVEGVDFETSYRMEPDFFNSQVESLSVRAIVGWLGEKSTTSPSGTLTDSVGGTLYPDYTGNVSVNYGLGPWSLQWQQRFISESKFNTTWIEGRDIDDNTVEFYSFTNAMIGYRGEMGNGGNWRLAFNINNMFDKAPAVIFSATGAQGTSVGDEYGRRYQLSLNINF